MRALETLHPQNQIVCVVIEGDPVSKARPRFSRNGHTYTPQKTIEGEKRLAESFDGVPRFGGNVAIVAIFRRRTKQRIDVDNMLKAVLDAGTRANLWADDSQVTALLGFVEHDSERPRTTIAFGRHASSLARGDDALIECESCDETFKPKNATQKYCSNRCRLKGDRKRRVGATSCRRGHDFTPENTWTRSNGTRRCRTCAAANQRRFRTKHYGEPARAEVQVARIPGEEKGWTS